MLRVNRFHQVFLVVLCAVSSNCRQVHMDVVPVDARTNADAAVEPSQARNDLVPVLGTTDRLDIATWNIENFPQRPVTAELVASLILSLELDVIAIQEIADTGAFDERLGMLPEYGVIRSDHTYYDGSHQKIGFIYPKGLLQPGDIDLLFTNDTYSFPRPPLQIQFTVIHPKSGIEVLDSTAIVVHLKAGVDTEDRMRRQDPVERLDTYTRALLAGPEDDDGIILGDFNEALDMNPVWARVGGRS